MSVLVAMKSLPWNSVALSANSRACIERGSLVWSDCELFVQCSVTRIKRKGWYMVEGKFWLFRIIRINCK